MARNYVTSTTSLWHDRDFVALTPQQQALYQMLKGQREITAAGTLPLTVRRWAKTSDWWTPELIEAELIELERHGHILVDRDTDEVLVVKFVKFDGGYRNEKRRPVIEESASAVISLELRAALADELDALNALPDTASQLRENTHADRASDRQSDSDRVVVTLGELDTPTPNPQPSTPSPGKPATVQSELRRAFDEFWSVYPLRTGKLAAERKFAIAAKRAEPRLIIDAARRFADANRLTDRQFIAHPATWLHQGRWDDEAPKPARAASAAPQIQTWSPPGDAS